MNIVLVHYVYSYNYTHQCPECMLVPIDKSTPSYMYVVRWTSPSFKMYIRGISAYACIKEE